MIVMTADALRESLNTLCPVQGVEDFRIEAGTDSTGDPAIWVFVVVDDARLDEVWPVWDQLRQDIREAVAGLVGSDVMVYVRMWSAGELEVLARAPTRQEVLERLAALPPVEGEPDVAAILREERDGR